MAPSMDDLEALLRQKAKDIFASDERDALTVKLVRNRVIKEAGLDDDVTTSAEWKALSKTAIQDQVQQLLEDEEKREEKASEEEPGPTPKRGLKRNSPDHEDRAQKQPRAKKVRKEPVKKPTKRRKSAKQDDEELPEQASGSEKEQKSPPAKAKRGPRKKKTPVSEVDSLSEPPSDDNEDSPKAKTKATKAEPTTKKVVVDDEDDDDLSDPPPEEEDDANAKDEDGDEEMKDGSEEKVESKPDGDVPEEDENEYSDVIDEEPKPKRKSKGSKEAKEPKEKGKRGRKAAAPPKAAPDLGPHEQEIKKLQGQLVKCGIRKIWAFELKKYGDDSRGKIRHLKDMLKDIGMDGRFSEAKAVAIKEQRELLADLEAVTEGERHWGVGGRASRGRGHKTYKVCSDSEDDAGGKGENGDDDGDGGGSSDDQGAKPKASRWRDQQAALAALLSGSESD